MTIDHRRIRAVAASLRGIRQRVADLDDVVFWNTQPFDRAVALLEDAIEGADFSGHALDDPELDRTDYLVHLDSLIAFLEVYEKEAETAGTLLSFPGRKS
jgi:hypothetical protein